MRIATWNVNSLTMRLPRVLDWLESTRPDVLCLQETKVADQLFPRAELAALGYDAATHGAGQWNGVAIISTVGLAAVRRGFPGEPGFPDPEARALAATCGPVRVWSLYVPNGRTVDSPHFAYKLSWLSALREALAAEAADAAPLAVCGDFNVAPTDSDVWDPAAFIGSTHVTAPERAAVTALLELGLTDVTARALKGPQPFTYWDYRGGNFHRGLGMRIDLVLLSAGLAAHISDAYVDRDARKGKAPSDHAPVVVDVDLGAG
ncbi:MAG TPA: exodeoxyribonuclease III [Candidatus Dormibacteraeota bacterium]|jgi:exodeoxyribonuclease-3|nr:exodeoxyribonuclease III [Candidatus Dormibacteraeota bacterium]